MGICGKDDNLKRKITSYFMIIILLTLVLVMLGFSYGIRSYYYRGVIETFKTHAEGVTLVWGTDMELSKSKLVEHSDDIIKAYEYNGADLQLLSRTGKLIQSSTGFYEEKTYKIDSSVLKQKTDSKIINIKNQGHILIVDTPLLYDDQVVGVLQYVTSLSKVESLIHSFLLYGILICAMVAVTVFLISLRLGNSFVKPIKDIIHFTEKMAEGKYKNRINETYSDELGELAMRLNFMADEILKTDRLKTDFISSISHELRTPLTGIKGWVETMKNPKDLTEEEMHFGIMMIDKESERLIGLVENLLDFSRYESERITLNLSSFSMEDLINEIVFQLKKKADQKDISVKVRTTPLSIIGDRDKLKQVLLNVLDNGIKFSKPKDCIEITQSRKEDFVEILVADHGIGIEKESLNHIMESFYKSDQKSIGAGLGLAISKNIVELHNGTIHVESDYQKGTTVNIQLPINRVQ